MANPFLQFKDKFLEAPIQLDPFPHLFIENIFPSDFYQMLLENLLTDKEMVPLGLTGKVSLGSYLERRIFDFSKLYIAGLSKKKTLFWRFFIEILKSDEFIKIQKEKFEPFFKKRYEDRYETINFYSYGELVRDYKNYSIGPHTDHFNKAVTMLFYFPKDDSQKHLGTSLYLPKKDGFICDGTRHHEFEDFQCIKTVPFLPNSLFCFVRSDSSFHGRELIDDENVERNMFNYALYKKI